MLLIYVDEVSKRLNYTLKTIFEVRGIDLHVTNDFESFKASTDLKFIYSNIPVEEDYLVITPSELLFQEEIRPQRVEKSNWEGEEVLSFSGFADILGSIFYVLSLYQEYDSEARDSHDRFLAEESVLVRFGWLEKLMVERWAEHFIRFLEKELASNLTTKHIPFEIIPTFDIDNTYAYKLKSGWRKWLSIGRDLVNLNKKRLKERREVMSSLSKDPYDTFDYIKEIAERGFSVKMFWLLGDYGTYDRNISYDHPYHQRLIRRMKDVAQIGLHPSYQSSESILKLQDEKNRLSAILDKEVTISRQHYLKMTVPSTYTRLIKLGFKEDFTLGFASHVGFRAGIARPFNWFNLKENVETNLILRPFSYMDGSLLEYNNYSSQEAKAKITDLMKEVKHYGGEFICIWHNETIGDYGKWKGWSEVLEHTLDFKED